MNLFVKLREFMQRDLPAVIETEGLNFIKKNFRDQGYTDRSFKKWKDRKTVDSKGKDLTRYRTNKVGTIGTLTKFGQKQNGRAILTGHRTGGNKLKNSFRARATASEVKFSTSKEYAEQHNEGKGHMPKRQFIGNSAYLNNKIKSKITRTLNNIFRNG
ncbi:hypothetical protein [Sphingobacterium multivorum]|uniref:hypothetical protein n=1 Tax=Sphingobacterium multivorum TaxID=28454 RepID=UPI003DA625CC